MDIAHRHVETPARACCRLVRAGCTSNVFVCLGLASTWLTVTSVVMYCAGLQSEMAGMPVCIIKAKLAAGLLDLDDSMFWDMDDFETEDEEVTAELEAFQERLQKAHVTSPGVSRMPCPRSAKSVCTTASMHSHRHHLRGSRVVRASK